MKKIYSLLIALLCSATMAFAYDAEIDGIYYDFDHENKTATVTHGGDYNHYSGDIIIPEKVTYYGEEYTVNVTDRYGCSKEPSANRVLL